MNKNQKTSPTRFNKTERKRMDEKQQPTIDELDQAWTKVIDCLSIGGAASESISELKEMMSRKTTWYGTKENEFRRAINNFLSYLKV
jgi:hypothetical protein